MPDIRKTLSDPKPLYFVAGAGEVAVEKLRDAPAKIAEAQERFSSDWFGEAQQRIVEAQSKVRNDLDSFRESLTGADLRGLRERAQVIALSQVGRALEVAGKAVEAYDDLAERGKSVVGRLLGEQVADEESPSTVIRVEQVQVDDATETEEPKTEAPKTTSKTAADKTDADKTDDGAAKPRARKTAAKKTTTAQKTTTPRKTATPKKDTAD